MALKFNDWLISLKENSNNKVSIFPGRFQPFQIGHINAMEKLYKQTGAKVVVIQIHSGSNKKTVFPLDLVNKISNDIEIEFQSFIEKIVNFPENMKSFVPNFYDIAKEYGEPIAIGCGTDRKMDYERQTKNYLLKDNPELNFNVIVIERNEDDPSSTKVREAIKNNDIETFKKLTPKSVHKYWNELKKYV